MSGNISNTATLSERLAGGQLTALLDGIAWDARETFDVVNPATGDPTTVISAIAGPVHVKGEFHPGAPDGLILVDVHASAEDAERCHVSAVSTMRTLALLTDVQSAMADAVRNISTDPGDTFVV